MGCKGVYITRTCYPDVFSLGFEGGTVVTVLIAAAPGHCLHFTILPLNGHMEYFKVCVTFYDQ